MKNHLAVIPFESIQRSVALCFAEVLAKGNRLRGDTPYANAFCRHAFGKSRPNRLTLLTIAESSYDSVPEIMRKLDLFLRSNGERRYLVDSYFAHKAFPSLNLKLENRLDNKIDMLLERDSKISDKAQGRERKQFENTLNEMMSIDKSQLPNWVRENESELPERELINCLSHWFNANVVSSWGFDDLYHGMKASRIALDLSFND